MNRLTKKCFIDRKIVESLIMKNSFNEMARILAVKKLTEEMGYLDQTFLPPYPNALFEYKQSQGLIPASPVDEALFGQVEWIKDKRELEWH